LFLGPDCTTLRGFLKKIEKTYGKAKRMWVMDRDIPTEAILLRCATRSARSTTW